MNFKSSSGNHKKVGCFYCSIGDNVHLDVCNTVNQYCCVKITMFFFPPWLWGGQTAREKIFWPENKKTRVMVVRKHTFHSSNSQAAAKLL